MFVILIFGARLMIKNGDGTACIGAATYETEYAIFSADGAHVLDIGEITWKHSFIQFSQEALVQGARWLPGTRPMGTPGNKLQSGSADIISRFHLNAIA